MKDIQVFTALDAKTVAAEKLDILLLSTEGAADLATYNAQGGISGEKGRGHGRQDVQSG